MHKRVAAALAAVMVMGAAAAAEPQAESRTATPAEQESFIDWYGSTHEGRGLLRPQFNVTREKGKRGKRRVTATVDGGAQRAVLPLCRQPRAVYEHDPRGRKENRWREAGPAQTLVWIHHASRCGAQPETPVRLLQPLPEMEILMLLQQHASILGSARLLMAGNTSCAPSRSRGYRLTGLDRGKDGLPVLVFESDIAGEARVSVRRSRNELLPWSVACAGPR
ncbi:hypothetical protein GJV26_09285 [Massilia dura]|uniref:Uncharacterized protein n=1 Tax=Pseudoduganella dura TaxID=321982 RepID=A0A6I3XHL9_9BURK|nr:hypothetical protein [Pseudoduganella dura]MUI12662.1 hypothetical protein [Pseudoduganella dura]GGX96763.1 hypothetical protein GCM10007386_29620 [Pseudoduganella dura]